MYDYGPLAGAGPDHTIVVTGEGVVAGEPDVAYLSLGASVIGKTASEASSGCRQVMSAVIEELKRRGVRAADLQTAGLNIQRHDPPRTPPGYPGVPPAPPPPGPPRAREPEEVRYFAHNSLHVTIAEVDRAGELLDAALEAGATGVNDLRFDIRNPRPLRDQALTLAVQDARAKADALAAGLGLRVVGVQNVHDAQIGILTAESRSMQLRAIIEPPSPLERGELHVTAQVRVTFLFAETPAP